MYILSQFLAMNFN